jgi:dephospho-CoA kinase
MLIVGVTGGIGSGKSTFAGLLARRGAQVIDADALGRAALVPGAPAWHSVVDQFGDEILAPDMEIDRQRLAQVVFSDPDALAALNAIVHPVIFARIAETLEMFAGTDEIVVIDAALIVEMGLASTVDALVVVSASREVRRTRLLRDRAMTLDDVNARMTAQADLEELLERADIVVTNDGSLDDLEREAERVWEELGRLRGAAP